MPASRPRLARVLLTNDDGIDAPGLAVLETSPPNSRTKCGLSPRARPERHLAFHQFAFAITRKPAQQVPLRVLGTPATAW